MFRRLLGVSLVLTLLFVLIAGIMATGLFSSPKAHCKVAPLHKPYTNMVEYRRGVYCRSITDGNFMLIIDGYPFEVPHQYVIGGIR